MKIYTRGGDDGSTGLYGGARVSKADLRVDAYGAVDELNAVLGWVRASDTSDNVDDILGRAQDTCFRLGAWLARCRVGVRCFAAPGPVGPCVVASSSSPPPLARTA